MQGAAHAREVPSDEGESAEAIVVTAQKREERLLDVPISITVVSGEQLAETGGQSLASVQDRVPGLFVATSGTYGSSPIGIRGVTGISTTFGDEPVAIYMDGVYRARAGFLGSSGLLDVAAVEVVRGPQGTLQGRNATSGAVLINSAAPESSLGRFAKLRAADPEGYRLEGAITGPLSRDLRARLAVSRTKEKGWGRSIATGDRLGSLDDNQARLSFALDAGPDTSMRLTLDYQRNELNPAIARWAATCFNSSIAQALVLAACNTPAVPLSRTEQARLYDGNFDLNYDGTSVAESWGGSLQLDHSFGAVDLVSITGYSEYSLEGASDSDGFGQIFAGDSRQAYNESIRNSAQFSQELRLQSGATDSPLSWILGAFYFLEQQDMNFAIVNDGLTPTNPAGTVPTRTRSEFLTTLDTDSWAVFGDATWRFDEQWALTGGIRYTEDKKDFTRDLRIFSTVTGLLTSNPPYTFPTSASWSSTSYRAKLSYQPTSDLLFYASYSTGFKAGGFNAFGGIGTAPFFDPETLASAELGIKLQLARLRGFIAASAYTNKYEGMQIRAGVPSGGVAIFNAANAKVDGFEVEGVVEPVRGLRLVANAAYANARYTSFPNARDVAERVVDATGNRLSRAPEWQYFMSAEYEMALSGNWEVTPQLSYSWRDRIYHLHTNQDSLAWQGEPLENLGARITFNYRPMSTRLGLYGTNLTDDRSVVNQGNTFNYPLASFNNPRTIGVFLENSF
jgi:iron complex outermembrane receptor protein